MTATTPRIPRTLLPGHGIGPEITAATLAALDDIQRTRLALKGSLITPVGSGYRSVNVRLREAIITTPGRPATATIDLGGPLGTREFAQAVIAKL